MPNIFELGYNQKTFNKLQNIKNNLQKTKEDEEKKR